MIYGLENAIALQQQIPSLSVKIADQVFFNIFGVGQSNKGALGSPATLADNDVGNDLMLCDGVLN